MENLFETVSQILKNDERFVSTEGTILKNAVYEASIKMDKRLIKSLYTNEKTRAIFFTDVDGIAVFDKVGFGWLINNQEFLPDSYTRYKNEIGLANSRGEFISSTEDVEIVFPYKDCFLEGGQTKEEAKRDEVFYNTLLAPNDVDRLLDPKVFVNPKRFSSSGVEEISSISQTDNLVIKGNNLLVLASLKERYAGLIKLIYIDVPYNTGSDSFGYNDSFKHSTWLTFMTNRLKIARDLLADDGCIFIQCDDKEQAYLKVLCDEIFERDNFVNCIAVKMSEETGVKMSHAKKRFPKLKEYLLFYKRPGFAGFERIDKYMIKEWDGENNIFLENFSKEDRAALAQIEENEVISEEDINRVIQILKPVKRVSLSQKMRELGIEGENEKDWLFENSYRIIKTCGAKSLLKKVKESGVTYNQEIACDLSKKGILFYYITDYNRNAADPRFRVIFADENIYKNPCDFWQDIKTSGAVADEGGVQLLNGKKPEKLLHRIISMVTNPGDIVLDFFAGSGTTGAVAHKMHRQYILCEQLDEHVDKELMRLQNVINGDSTGISALVNWTGGDSFVYCELSELNNKFIHQIQNADNEDRLISIWHDILNSAFISCYVKPEDVKKTQSEFSNLSFEDKQRMLIDLLDLNQLYVNYCDIEDETYGISNNDKQFTKSFYGDK